MPFERQLFTMLFRLDWHGGERPPVFLRTLDAHWFTTLTEAKRVIEAWRREHNESRPHRALGEKTPSEFACQDAAQRDLGGGKTAGD